MSSIVKETESPAPAAPANSAPGVPAKPREEAAAKLQPVPIEIGIAVNGARAIDGTDKREPFSESTKTVLVFGHGAVIKLSSNVAAGQLLFVTNEQTRKEVVCQVVKSKIVSPTLVYVELEFTEAAPGFWGMRFPNDHVKPAPRAAAPAASKPAAPVATKPAVAPPAVPAAPAAPVAPKPVAPVVAEVAAAPVMSTPVAPPPVVASAPEVQAPEPKPMEVTETVAEVAAPAPVEAAAPAVVKVEAPVAPAQVVKAPEPPKSSDATTEALRQQAAKLQEQLSSMLFTEQKPVEAAAPKEPVAAPSEAKEASTELSAKIMEIIEAPAKPATPPAKAAAPAKKTSFGSLAEEESKIPAWLAPLAKESDFQAQAEAQQAESKSEQAAFSETEEVAQVSDAEELRDEEAAASEEGRAREAAPMFGGQLVTDKASEGSASGGSSKLKFIGIAAALLLLAGGGYWYSQQPGNALSGLLGAKAPAATKSAPAQAKSAPAPATGAAVSSSTPEQPAASSNASASVPTPEPAAVQPPVATVQNQPTPSLTPAVSKEPGNVAAGNNVVPSARNAAPAQKKPSLGNVSLAAPVVNRNAGGEAIGSGEPAIDGVQPVGGDALSGGIATAPRKQPVMPAPVGGDVKNAVLLKSVPPIYPQQAKAQHIVGTVQIDALIDETGNVSTAKILSGPALLHAAALAAVKQWKYSPAQLDGKATAVHLTVSVQFHQ